MLCRACYSFEYAMLWLNSTYWSMWQSLSQASSEPFRVVELQEDGMIIAIDLQFLVSGGLTPRLLLLDMSECFCQNLSSVLGMGQKLLLYYLLHDYTTIDFHWPAILGFLPGTMVLSLVPVILLCENRAWTQDKRPWNVLRILVPLSPEVTWHPGDMRNPCDTPGFNVSVIVSMIVRG